MATAAQITANRANAHHSTGPNTPAGKAASSRNAVTHGLSSPLVVLAHEDQDEFNELVDCMRDEHQPANPHQAFLVDQLAITQWQLARAQRLQTAALSQLAGAVPPSATPDQRIVAEMFKTNPNILATLQRYAAQAERSYYKACRELKIAKQIQGDAERLEHPSSPAQAPAPKPQPAAAPKPSVQNKPNPAPAASAPTPPPPAKPSLRSQLPENLARCL